MKKTTEKLLPLFRAQAGTFEQIKSKFVRPVTPVEPEPRPARGERLSPRLWAVAGIALALFVHWEMATAALESRFFSALASKMRYSLQPGRSPSIAFPRHGPFDERFGYSKVPEFTQRLEDRGFQVSSQVRFTRTLALVARLGVDPPYREPSSAGLVIDGTEGVPLYEAMGSRRTFASFEDIPADAVKCLLFIENRELDQNKSPYSNPAIDWSRTAKGLFLYMASHIGVPMPVEGGSTLAVQMEKYRHSPDGRTGSAVDKLRQMIGASLRVYRNGPETADERRRIVVDYVNTVPLGGAPGYGEVFGLDDGLRVWFGQSPEKVYRTLASSKSTKARAKALKPVLALVCAVRAPTRYLTNDREALEERVDRYAKLMGARGVIAPKLADALVKTRLQFAPALAPANRRDLEKATVLVRRRLVNLLAVRDLYELDRLHMKVETTINADLQRDVTAFFRRMADPEFVSANGLRAERLLASGDPSRVIYSLVLRERTPEGDVVRVHADNLEGPFDVNEGMMMELGSTAKLRTLVHYLELIARLHQELSGLAPSALESRIATARDPLTRWASEALAAAPKMPLQAFLEASLERTYSASPYELFYTGGGIHTFQNYEPDDNGKIMTLREGAVHSTNLVFIRLMRDLVRYHEARLPYDVDRILGPVDTPERLAMLREVAPEEGTPEEMAWLFRTRNRQAQDLRLRTRIERDAFARMTPHWRRLGFPFPHLVPSYATAIGSSSDQPAALADLMGLLMNDGVRRPPMLIRKVSFAEGTPYETALQAPAAPRGELLIAPEVARATRGVLGAVVERGTAQRLRGVFVDSTGAPIWIGGKTGTGDNRRDSYGPGRRLIASRAVSRTAAFAFCLSDRYYGVITTSVTGPQTDQYSFTSSLPLAAMKLLAPTIERRLHMVGGETGVDPEAEPAVDPALIASSEPTAALAATTEAIAGSAPPTEATAGSPFQDESLVPREPENRDREEANAIAASKVRTEERGDDASLREIAKERRDEQARLESKERREELREARERKEERAAAREAKERRKEREAREAKERREAKELREARDRQEKRERLEAKTRKEEERREARERKDEERREAKARKDEERREAKARKEEERREAKERKAEKERREAKERKADREVRDSRERRDDREASEPEESPSTRESAPTPHSAAGRL